MQSAFEKQIAVVFTEIHFNSRTSGKNISRLLLQYSKRAKRRSVSFMYRGIRLLKFFTETFHVLMMVLVIIVLHIDTNRNLSNKCPGFLRLQQKNPHRKVIFSPGSLCIPDMQL